MSVKGFDPYADFAERYDLLFGPFGEHASDRVEFFRSLFASVRVRRILDCACGTGRDLHLLHDAGYEVWGSDISHAMLTQARENLASLGVTVPLTRADFRSLPFRRHHFEAVLCLTTSLPHLLDERQVVGTLQGIKAMLRDGGIVVLSQGLSDRILDQRPRFIPEINTRDLSRVFVLDYFDRTVEIHILDLFHEADRQEFKVDTFEYLIIRQDDYQRILDEAGYAKVEFYGSFSLDEYDKATSDQLIVVAHA
jgi:ubiquinone/menaquinone biosynthesis C-methylase UbiE